jgi:RNase P/RNase MRP subunit p29
LVAKNSLPFIGKKVEILSSSNESYIGTVGIILDETKNSFIIDVNGKRKIMLKKGTQFVINKQIVCGDDIAKRIEERIKKLK